MKLKKSTLKKWSDLVLSEYPNEACAFIVDGDLFPVKNISDEPTRSFKFSSLERLAAHTKGKVEAFLHSHPYDVKDSNFTHDPSWASHADMVSWIADNIPWGIVATDGEGLSPMIWYDDSIGAIEPYEGRSFSSGKHDCFSLVRDYYRKELDVRYDNYPRAYGWWDQGEDHYEKNFAEAGFEVIDMQDLRPGDTLLMNVVGPVISHAAIVVDTNKILHHMVNRLSGYDTIAKWHRHVVKAIRYNNLK
jgi:cell wall-associated NlpC family hydrolase